MIYRNHIKEKINRIRAEFGFTSGEARPLPYRGPEKPVPDDCCPCSQRKSPRLIIEQPISVRPWPISTVHFRSIFLRCDV